MKPYLIGLFVLALAMAAYSQGTLKMAATNDNSMQARTTNMTGKTEEYLNPGEPIQVKAGQNFTIRLKSSPTTGYGWQLSKALDNKSSTYALTNEKQTRKLTIRNNAG